MWSLLESSLIVGILYIVDMVMKQKRKIHIYIVIFLLLSLVNFFFGKVYASDRWNENCQIECYSECIPDAKIEIKHLREFLKNVEDFQCKLSPEDKKFYENKVRFHLSNAERTYRDAKNKCWWLPEVSDREKAKYCFSAAISTLGASSPMSKIVAATVSLLLQYGLDCIDEWGYIKNKLHWSEYHYEMMEFYQEVLAQG